MLDLSSLNKSVSSIQRAISYAQQRESQVATVELEEREVLMAAVVQNFEFTYELCWKFMRRWLENNLGTGSTSGITKKQLFRLAGEQCLIEDVEAWFRFHELRNLTSHTYDLNVATEIYKEARGFAQSAVFLLHALETRND